MPLTARLPRDAAAEPPERPADESVLSSMDRRVAPRRITPGRLAGAGVIVVVIAVGSYGYVRFGLERTQAVSRERVTISTVENAVFRDYVPVTGSVAPQTTIYLDTIESGQVTAVLVEEGVQVAEGQLLASLKNTRLELEVVGTEAQLTEQQNNLDNARLAFQQAELRHRRDLMTVRLEIDRLEDLLARRRPLAGNAIPVSEIDDLEARLAHQRALESVVERARAAERALAERTIAQREAAMAGMTERLTLVQQSLGNLAITSPLDGQLTVFDLHEGEVVQAGQRIGQVDANDAFKISALVDEFYLGRIASGQRADVEIAGRKHALEVSKVYPNVQDRVFQVDLAFPGEAPDGLRRGQTVRPRIELGESSESLVVANGPYYDETGGLWVMVVSADGDSAQPRSVRLGRRNPEQVEVLAHLSEGERVITSSYQGFKDAERIDFR